MKKWLVFMLIIMLVSCSSKLVQEESALQEGAQEPQASAPEPAPVAEVLSSPVDIESAMMQGTPIKCVYQEGGEIGIMYIKGEKMRSESPEENAIFDKKIIYAWKGSEGWKIDLEKMKEQFPGAQEKQATKEEMIEDAKSKNAQCEHAQIPDSMFMPPTDIVFQDLGEMFAQMAKGMQEAMTPQN